MKKIVILGSTGSIGTQALDVLEHLPKKDYTVVGLTAYSNIPLVKAQIRRFHPEIVSVGKERDALTLEAWCRKNGRKTKVTWGLKGLTAAAKYGRANFVLSAVVGSIGIEPLLEAIKQKKQVALANKEALVVAGKQIMDAARKNNVSIIPVDSEHSAIFQCLKNEEGRSVKRIILTASGGPFYRRKSSSRVSVAEALSHPTWKMGRKITIDSATLMNKGLEAIEASWLFNVPLKDIEILIHPQSIVHSMVEFIDGSVLAQMSDPDMRLPIQYALTYPGRVASKVKTLSLEKVGNLEFKKPDFKRFPCLSLALQAGNLGGIMPVVMNAANEVAVNAFLNKKIKFSDIPVIIAKVMKSQKPAKDLSLDRIHAKDLAARDQARKYILKTEGK